MSAAKALVVVSSITPNEIERDGGKPVISSEEHANDALDDFNHPRYRRGLILQSLQENYGDKVSFTVPSAPKENLGDYLCIHSHGLVEFLSSAWTTWEALGEEGQDPSSALKITTSKHTIKPPTPALIPINAPLGRDPYQRPSKHVAGQMGYYCTDSCTPVFASLFDELCMDAAIIEMSVEKALQGGVAYALPTHPGHHAAKDSFGGYCYLSHASRAARLLQTKLGGAKVAILDVGMWLKEMNRERL